MILHSLYKALYKNFFCSYLIFMVSVLEEEVKFTLKRKNARTIMSSRILRGAEGKTQNIGGKKGDGRREW